MLHKRENHRNMICRSYLESIRSLNLHLLIIFIDYMAVYYAFDKETVYFFK